MQVGGLEYQVGSQGKTWYQPGTFSKARIISYFDTEPIDRIIPPTIPHTVQRLLQHSEDIKWKSSNRLQLETNIRA